MATKNELYKLVGKNVRIIFEDGKTEQGILGFAAEFGSKYGYRKPNKFYINDLSFCVSSVKKIVEEIKA